MRAVFFVAVLLASRAALAGPLACRAPVEDNAGEALFTKTPAEIADRCASQLGGSLATSAGAVECLLLVHDVDGLVPHLPAKAKTALEKLVRNAPSAGIQVDPPVVFRSLELLTLADRDAALALAHELTSYGSDPLLAARGAEALALAGTDDDLRTLALGVVSRKRDVRVTTVEALARRASPITNPLLMPLLSDPDHALAKAVEEGLGSSPGADPATLREVLASAKPDRVDVFVNALAERAEPRAGREPIRSDALAERLLAGADGCEALGKLSPTRIQAALRVAGDDVRTKAPALAAECGASNRALVLGIAEWAGFAKDADTRQRFAEVAKKAMDASKDQTFSDVDRALVAGLADGSSVDVQKWLDGARTNETIEAIRWGGQGAAARELRAFGKRAFTEQVPGCESASMLLDAYAAMRAAERRGPASPPVTPPKKKRNR